MAHSKLSTIFTQAARARVFPGGAVWLSHADKVLAEAAFGTTAYDDAISQTVTTETIYDLASVSKLFTMTAWLIAAQESQIEVQTPLFHFFPEFAAEDKRAITIRELLNHTSGIEIAIQSFTPRPTIAGEEHEKNNRFTPVEKWIERIATAPLKSAPGEQVLYSCTNYFLLARVIEELCGQRLDEFIAARIFQPLQMARTSFTPCKYFEAPTIAPTEINAGTQTPFHGIVHDEAAREWQRETGGFCGNAGVFSTARDLSRFAKLWIERGEFGGQQILDPVLVQRAFADTVREDSETQRGWCWQIFAPSYMSLDAPRDSAGHGGFTGPTLMLNPRTQHIAIILENRVYPTRHGPIRMPFHRRITQWLLAQSREDEN